MNDSETLLQLQLLQLLQPVQNQFGQNGGRRRNPRMDRGIHAMSQLHSTETVRPPPRPALRWEIWGF
jgi:hypothetical protein